MGEVKDTEHTKKKGKTQGYQDINGGQDHHLDYYGNRLLLHVIPLLSDVDPVNEVTGVGNQSPPRPFY
jgi:hypothetical protein